MARRVRAAAPAAAPMFKLAPIDEEKVLHRFTGSARSTDPVSSSAIESGVVNYRRISASCPLRHWRAAKAAGCDDCAGCPTALPNDGCGHPLPMPITRFRPSSVGAVTRFDLCWPVGHPQCGR